MSQAERAIATTTTAIRRRRKADTIIAQMHTYK